MTHRQVGHACPTCGYGDGNEARLTSGRARCRRIDRNRKRIASFRDLEVYRSTYQAMLAVMKEIVPGLPDSEKYDLKDQLSRASKSVPRLISEGYAKRHQRRGFQRYIDDAMGECNELVVSLSQVRDLYHKHVDPRRCEELIDVYDKSGRQLYRLGDAWRSFKDNGR